MDVLQQPVESIVVGTATAGTATATLAAAGAAFRWRITGVKASFSGAAVATPVRATLTVNGVAINVGVSTNDAWKESFVNPLVSEANGAPSLALASGGASAVGDVIITAHKEPVTPMPA